MCRDAQVEPRELANAEGARLTPRGATQSSELLRSDSRSGDGKRSALYCSAQAAALAPPSKSASLARAVVRRASRDMRDSICSLFVLASAPPESSDGECRLIYAVFNPSSLGPPEYRLTRALTGGQRNGAESPKPK